MARKLLNHKSKLTLWLNNEIFLGLSNIAVWRIIWSNLDRIILNFDMPISGNLKKILEMDTFNLGIFYHECGRLDTLESALSVMTLENCKLNRRWIPHLTTLDYSNDMAQAFAEFTCKIVEHNG